MYKKIVKQTLEDSYSSRDNDQLLYSDVLARLNFDIYKNSAMSLINGISAKTLPSSDTITRLRRALQLDNPSLRGDDWDIRHGVKVQKALTDLGYSTATR